MGDKIVIHTGKSSGFTNTHQNSKAVSNRLSRAIGHLESIRRMVEDGRDCTEVLLQLSGQISGQQCRKSDSSGSY